MTTTSPVVKPTLAARYSKALGSIIGIAVSGLLALGSAQLFSGQVSHNLIVVSGILSALIVPISTALAPENKKAFTDAELAAEQSVTERFASSIGDIRVVRDQLVELGIVTPVTATRSAFAPLPATAANPAVPSLLDPGTKGPGPEWATDEQPFTGGPDGGPQI